MDAVNNAGFVLGIDRVGAISDSDVESMFNTNVLGLISVTQLFVKGEMNMTLRKSFTFNSHISKHLEFKARKAGHIINLGSVAGTLMALFWN